jgi:trans-aconitate 2-methyltransferase
MWDPQTYLAFADYRNRPFHELVARIGAVEPRRVVDLGCGPGNLTVTLAERWPNADVQGFDSSPEMIEQARARGVKASVADIADWTPAPDVDVVVSNAALHWLPQYAELLRNWLPALSADAWFAMQVPGNFAEPSHALTRELATESQWKDALSEVVLREKNVVLEPADYASLAASAGCDIDAWETTYLHALQGENPVLEWISGTALRPIRAALDDEQWQRFRAELAPRLRAAYPQRADGTTWFSFRRVFVVAHRR